MACACDEKTSPYMQNLCNYVLSQKFILLQFRRFHVEKNWAQKYISGEKMTNIRSASGNSNASLHLVHWSDDHGLFVGDYLRAYSAWICAKSARWIFFSRKKAHWALVYLRTGMSGIFQNCQSCTESVKLEKKKYSMNCVNLKVLWVHVSSTELACYKLRTYWVGPVPNLELLGLNQKKNTL